MVQFNASYFIIQFINLNQPDKVAALIEVFMHCTHVDLTYVTTDNNLKVPNTKSWVLTLLSPESLDLSLDSTPRNSKSQGITFVRLISFTHFTQGTKEEEPKRSIFSNLDLLERWSWRLERKPRGKLL